MRCSAAAAASAAAPISIRYPLVELTTMALFVLHGVVFGWSRSSCRGCCLRCAMVVLFAIDLEHHLLPNVITLPGIASASSPAPCCRPGSWMR